MAELARAWALMDRIDEGVAERVEPTEHGHLIVSTQRFQVHDENFLRVEAPGSATARDLAAEADAAQGGYREVRHRRVNVRGEEASARLEPGFRELGWAPSRFVLMIQRGEPDRAADPTVHVAEATQAQMRAAWLEGGRSFGGSDELVRQMVEHHAAVGRAVPTRYFAVEADRRIAAYCELYSLDRVGQVENVVTLPEFRGRGLARALVTRATDESRAKGNDLTFLVADADDWPHTLYEKLGYAVCGRYARFLRTEP